MTEDTAVNSPGPSMGEAVGQEEIQMMKGGSGGHPTGLYVLFFTEMWERFSYYGMRAIMALYMAKALLFDKAFASEVYGSYTGLVYLTPLLGGYMADRYWGNRRSILVGGILMALGQFSMFFSASNYLDLAIAKPMFYTGLGFLIFGNGFFKPNISTMVGSLYPPGDKRVDSAFTIFYMGINLGALAAPLVCGGLGDTGDPADFKWGFLAAGIGMLLGILIFEGFKKKYIVTHDGQPVGLPPVKAPQPVLAEGEIRPSAFNPAQIAIWGAVYIAMIVGFYYGLDMDLIGSFIYTTTIVGPLAIIMDKSLNTVEKQRIGVIYILAFFVIFFWAAFEQAGASLTFFADEQTNRDLLGFTVPASYFQSINPIAIVVFAPLFAMLWTALGKRNIEPSSPLKMAIGLLLLSLGYLVIAFGVKGVEPGVKVSMLWLLTMYLLHTFGELSLSPIGLSMVNKLSPLRLASLLMGVWFLSTATANKFAGVLSGLYPDPTSGKEPPVFMGIVVNDLYTFFMIFVVMSAASSLILFLVYRRLLKMMHGIQ